MLRILIILLILPITALCKEGKWITVDRYAFIDNRGDSVGYSYWAIDCYDCNNCIAVGNASFLEPMNRITHDGGKTWQNTLYDHMRRDTINGEVKYYHPARVYDVSYPSQNLCIALCDSGYYWRSTDKLKTWKRHRVDINRKPNMYLNFHINMIDESNGVFITPFEFFETNDGGLQWNKKEIKTNIQDYDDPLIRRFFMVSADKMYLLGYKKEFDNYLLHSSDKGNTWKFITDFDYRLATISFIDEKTGFAGGFIGSNGHYASTIYKTTDGGFTWENKLDTLIYPHRGIDEIEIFDDKNAVAYSDYYHNFWRTYDGGETWIRDSSVTYSTFKAFLPDIKAVSHNCMYAVTDMWKKIFKYTDEEVSVSEEVFKGRDDLKIFPNPIGDYFNLSFKSVGYGEAVLELYNMRGVLMQRERLGPVARQRYSARINAENLPAGSYYAVVVLPQRRLSGVVIKH